jgi:hypothetical protein
LERLYLTQGQAHELEGRDVYLPALQARALLVDKTFDADKRVIQKMEAQGAEVVIPLKSNRKNPCQLIKLANSFLGGIDVPSIVIWLN